MRRILVVLVGLALGLGLVSANSVARADVPSEPHGPYQTSFVPAFGYSLLSPDAAPQGSNDWSCRPPSAHPQPVVLVHGTFADQYSSFAYLAPRLKAAGYCVFSLNYGRYAGAAASGLPGVYAVGPVMDSARELGGFVNQVLAATGAGQVDLVGYSQGAIVARGYLKFFGGADAANPALDKVKRLVSISGTNHGTTLSGLAVLASQLRLFGLSQVVLGPAATEQIVGSAYLAQLNAGGDTMPGVDYTMIVTKYDEVSTPYRNSFLTAGPGATVANVTLQDGCALDLSDHLSIPYSPRAADLTLRALDPGTPRTIACVPEVAVF